MILDVLMNKRFNAAQTCSILGISRRTLGRMLERNEIDSIVVNNRHYFTEETLNEFVGYKTLDRGIYLYSRVSSSKQKNDLLSQQKLLEEYAASKGYIIEEHLSDIGSGINFKRKNFLKLINLILENKVSKVIITYEDRMARFAFDLLVDICNKFSCKIEVINLISSSPQEELMEDLMSIVHEFSSRLHGLRRNKKVINDLCRKDQNSA